MQRRTRRGSAYVSPVSSSSSEGDEEAYPVAAVRRGSQWSRRQRQVSSSSSSSSSDEEEDHDDVGEDHAGDTDELEDFVVTRRTRERRASVAKLDRLRRIFLNQPPAKARNSKQPKRNKDVDNQDAPSTTTSNSSDENVVATERRDAKEDPETMTLAIGHHVAALRDQVQRLARHHDAHAQQWQTMLTQAIAELTFVKQQEERALQSHARLVQESYALRLEIFEQQYRAKVAEIRDAMRVEIAQQRQQSEAAVVAAAQRLQQQTQQLFVADGDAIVNAPSLVKPSQTPPVVDTTAVLAKTTAFLDRQRAREDARRRRVAEASPGGVSSTAAAVVLSPVAKQRAKLRALEQKLATFSPATVDRVARTVEQHARARRDRVASTTPAARSETPRDDSRLRPTPLSPVRRRGSHWHHGISREDPVECDAEPERLSRRFLRPEEERELRMLRNRIGLAQDWMAQHTRRPRHDGDDEDDDDQVSVNT